MLDASHPNVVAAHGDCESYYVPSSTHPGVAFPCTWFPNGKCKPDKTEPWCGIPPPGLPTPMVPES